MYCSCIIDTMTQITVISDNSVRTEQLTAAVIFFRKQHAMDIRHIHSIISKNIIENLTLPSH